MSVITPTFVSPETNAESASLDGAAAAAEVGEEEEDIQCVPCDPCEEYGIRVAKFKRGPKEPTKDEICEHYKTHIPYRSWCPHCVAAAGKASPHRNLKEGKDGSVPCVHADYWFMREARGPSRCL